MSEKMGVCTIVPRDQKGFRPLVFGMGILVNGREIVTCAHVIDVALGPGWQELKERAVVGICFPFVDGFPCLEGTVDEKRSIPPGRTSGGEPSDVAVIQLTQEAPPSAERAVLKSHVMDAHAKAYGFRGKEDGAGWKSHPNGGWSEGKIVGAATRLGGPSSTDFATSVLLWSRGSAGLAFMTPIWTVSWE